MAKTMKAAETVALHVDDYRAVCEAVEAFREFVAEVRRDHDVEGINAVALSAAQAEHALDQVVDLA